MVNIINKKNCTGCHACFNICPQKCIAMESDKEGFWYPIMDTDKCIDCGLCEKVCPILNKEEIRNEPYAYACINKDEEIRMESSSGGIFTLIAEQVIDNGGVVFGAAFNKELDVVHSFVERNHELSRFRGSKYVQSRIEDTYKITENYLKEGRQVLFSGTPCQIGGLKSYLRKDYNNLLTIDNVCHGVPSPRVWRKYLKYHSELDCSSVEKVNFRFKNPGWKQYSLKLTYDNSNTRQIRRNNDLYMKAFLKDICLRPSCYTCEFKTLHRQSDITLADFWGIQNVSPEMDDDKGTSLIFINSTKGQSMLEQIKGSTLYNEVDINKAVAYNTAAIKSAKYNPRRDSFFAELDKKSFNQLIKEYCSDRIIVRVERKLKTIASIVLKKTGLLSVVKNLLRGQ